jgi:ABC-type transport system substrate-binding protein
MQSNSYWSRVLTRRLSRRRALAGTASVGAAAAFLAACGGGDEGGEQGSGLIVQQDDRSKDAKAGGTLNHTQQNAPSLDAIGSAATLTRFGIQMLYTRMFRVMPGINEPSSGEITGDTAESWEFSPDKLTLTFKIRGNLGSDPRPPLNGRNLTSEDVVFSWNKFAEKSSLRSDLVNSVNPNGSVQTVTAPDRNTVQFKLAFPSVILTDYLADGFYFWVMPKESEGGFNPDSAAHGAGPYILDEYLSGAHYRMSRNPNFYDKPKPYFDKQNWFIVPEAAAQVAQFEAKALDIGAGLTGINSENIVDIKTRHPELIMYELPIPGIVSLRLCPGRTLPRRARSPGDFHGLRPGGAGRVLYELQQASESGSAGRLQVGVAHLGHVGHLKRPARRKGAGRKRAVVQVQHSRG